MLGDRHLAEDAVQNAWVASLQNRSDVKSALGWFAGAVSHALGVRSLAKGAMLEDGSALRWVPAPGEYKAQLMIDYATRPGYHIQRKLKPERPIQLTLLPDPSRVATFEVQVDEQAYAEALGYVRDRFDEEVAAGILPADLVFGETHVE